MTINCNRCGRECDADLPERVAEYFVNRGEPVPWLCSTCFEAREREDELKRKVTKREEDEWLDNAVHVAGVRPLYNLRAPIVPYVSDWLLAHTNENVLLSGETGTGKSTSAGYLVRSLLREKHTVGMYYLSELLDKWRSVRCDNDHPEGIKAMFEALEDDDYIVIDECAGKTVNSDSTREFMFRFLEDITNGVCRSKVFLLGNFYTGSVADVFGDEAPAMRRIRENFTCGRIDPKKQAVVPIFKR